MSLHKPIGRAKCILVRHDWEIGRQKFRVTEGKVYDVLRVVHNEWLLIIADDGNRGCYMQDWFEWVEK